MLNIIEVKKEFICLPQFPSDPLQCGKPGPCFPSPCDVVHCLCMFAVQCVPSPFILSNADAQISVKNNGIVVIPSPSEVLQYVIMSTPCPGQIEARTFRFPCIPNVNKDRFLIQFRNTDGILECREVFFADIDKHTCKKKCC